MRHFQMSLLEHAIPTCLPKLQAQAPKILPGVEICGEKRGNNHPCVITMTRTCMQQTQMTKKKKKSHYFCPETKTSNAPPTHTKQRQIVIEKAAHQGRWNTITTRITYCYTIPPTLTVNPWVQLLRSLWSPSCLPLSLCRTASAALCTRSWWTPTGRRISLWTCGLAPRPQPWSW